MPRRVKRKRPIVLDDGSQPGGMEEYYDYIFPVGGWGGVAVCVSMWCVCMCVFGASSVAGRQTQNPDKQASVLWCVGRGVYGSMVEGGRGPGRRRPACCQGLALTLDISSNVFFVNHTALLLLQNPAAAGMVTTAPWMLNAAQHRRSHLRRPVCRTRRRRRPTSSCWRWPTSGSGRRWRATPTELPPGHRLHFQGPPLSPLPVLVAPPAPYRFSLPAFSCSSAAAAPAAISPAQCSLCCYTLCCPA